jgi:hypothetical protein
MNQNQIRVVRFKRLTRDKNMETIFSLANLYVLPFWLLMILAPHWSWTKKFVNPLWLVIPLMATYAFMVVPGLPLLLGSLANPALSGIATLLGSPEGATIGWIHFLAFDLFVGRWVYLDSREKNITAWLVSPILFFVFMLGPLGLLLYLAARFFWQARK